jgi:hypothetical protein
MDIGSFVSWIQAALWVIAAALWIARVVRGEAKMQPWLKKLLSSNRLIGTVVLLGLIMSGISLYMSYAVNAFPKSLTLNTSAYEPQYAAPMRVISNQTFEDQEIQLDGFIYQGCTFTNVCFIYDGGAFGLQNSTVKNHWKVCEKEQRLKNYANLLEALRMFSSKIEHTKKTIINR